MWADLLDYCFVSFAISRNANYSPVLAFNFKHELSEDCPLGLITHCTDLEYFWQDFIWKKKCILYITKFLSARLLLQIRDILISHFLQEFFCNVLQNVSVIQFCGKIIIFCVVHLTTFPTILIKQHTED